MVVAPFVPSLLIPPVNDVTEFSSNIIVPMLYISFNAPFAVLPVNVVVPEKVIVPSFPIAPPLTPAVLPV